MFKSLTLIRWDEHMSNFEEIGHSSYICVAEPISIKKRIILSFLKGIVIQKGFYRAVQPPSTVMMEPTI
jgi:hypothetical protein